MNFSLGASATFLHFGSIYVALSYYLRKRIVLLYGRSMFV